MARQSVVFTGNGAALSSAGMRENDSVLVTKNNSPCTLTHLLYFAISLGAAFGGYFVGKLLVVNCYNQGGEMSRIMGGYAGAEGAFDLTHQLAVDFSRTGWGKRLDKKMPKSMRQARISLFSQNTNEGDPLTTAPSSIAAPSLEWDESLGDSVRIVFSRLSHYLGVFIRAGGVTALPVALEFGGANIFSTSAEDCCALMALLVAATSYADAQSAYRADQPSARVISRAPSL